jgi:hypothetical protein
MTGSADRVNLYAWVTGVRIWPLCEVARRGFEVCFGVVSGPELLRSSVSHFDPKRSSVSAGAN